MNARERSVAASAAVLGWLAVWTAVAVGAGVDARVVSGRSMEPALLLGDRVVVDRWTYRHRRPRLGEIVMLRDPEGRVVVKRVARGPGFPDDRPRAGWWPGPPIASGVWVLGDGVAVSDDSRRYGPVPTARILGRVSWIYWPPSRFGAVPPASSTAPAPPVR